MCPLPPEIVYEILSYSLNDHAQIRHRSPAALLTSNSVFCDITQQILYTELYFKSHAQLSAFTAVYSAKPPLYAPRFAEFDVVGPDSGMLFLDLHELFSRCFTGDMDSLKGIEKDPQGRLSLDLLRICANTHAFGFDSQRIYTSLSLVNPKRFIWVGPDPPHHFSIAIVPPALPHLFQALSTHSNLTYLKLTHISMTFVNHGKLPILPSLQIFHFGQVVFLEPSDISSFVLHPSMCNLREVRLVDAYKGSIWGARLRRTDIEQAASASLRNSQDPSSTDTNDQASIIETNRDIIRRIIVCKATTERIIGGDRVERDEDLL